mmetsp:Transcript_10907/g.23295  ORF Transcript_10907/g.23295 Transcript_10907/m.23295 type:complete len:180 (+) Transcript_10907:812-1351(+)
MDRKQYSIGRLGPQHGRNHRNRGRRRAAAHSCGRDDLRRVYPRRVQERRRAVSKTQEEEMRSPLSSEFSCGSCSAPVWSCCAHFLLLLGMQRWSFRDQRTLSLVEGLLALLFKLWARLVGGKKRESSSNELALRRGGGAERVLPKLKRRFYANKLRYFALCSVLFICSGFIFSRVLVFL